MLRHTPKEMFLPTGDRSLNTFPSILRIPNASSVTPGGTVPGVMQWSGRATLDMDLGCAIRMI
jgi:hypothetical protein